MESGRQGKTREVKDERALCTQPALFNALPTLMKLNIVNVYDVRCSSSHCTIDMQIECI